MFQNEQWDFVARLGPNAFQIMNWWAATTCLLALTRRKPIEEHALTGWDVGDLKSQDDKAQGLSERVPKLANQRSQLSNPGLALSFENVGSAKPLGEHADVYYGSKPGQTSRVTRYFWEVSGAAPEWRFMESSPDGLSDYSGKSEVCLTTLEIEKQRIDEFGVRGAAAWGKEGVIFAKMRSLPCTVYLGEFYDDNTYAVVPKNSKHLSAIFLYFRSGEFNRDARHLNQKSNITRELAEAIPFDLLRWKQLAEIEYPSGLPAPASADPSQWLFDGHPAHSTHPLQVAVARLVGYRWPRQDGASFAKCAVVADDGLSPHADADGITCLSSVSGGAPAADRLRALLADAYGTEWSAARLGELLDGYPSLETWLKNRFFEEHCEFFSSRPFVWHVWDGCRDGFQALVNYHKLAGPNGEGRKTMEKLIYSSLGDWIRRQDDEVKNGADGAEARLTSAQHLKTELIKILHGEPPYDLFIRWKPLHQQPMGWEPDINDGVRLNMRPWLHAKPYQAPNQKLKQGACILRATPIKLPLGKDRSKELLRDKDDFPWYATSQDRTNDLHFTLDEKRAARERKKKA